MPLMSFRSLAVVAALVFAPPTAAMADYAVIGDSLGVGVNWAAKSRLSLARNSIAIHGGAILEQIRQLPRGTIAFMSLGTNDAVGGAVDVRKPVQDILAAVAARDAKLVWLGPPCVKKSWDAYSKKLDANLQEQLKGTGVIYVGMRGSDLCDNPSLRGREGVHFTMAGYTLMWRKAAAAAGFPVTVAANDNPALMKDNQKKKPSPKRHRKRKPTAPSAPAPNKEAIPGAT
jgi:hypothetical protein